MHAGRFSAQYCERAESSRRLRRSSSSLVGSSQNAWDSTHPIEMVAELQREMQTECLVERRQYVAR